MSALQTTKNISIFSFFSGAGFLDLGFEEEGYDVCFANEFHDPFLEAYRHSRSVMSIPEPRYGYHSESIEDIDFNMLSTFIHAEVESNKTIGFIGGPPCPDFSIAGKNRGVDGENGRLSEIYVNIVCRHKPDFFLFENVKGLYRTKKHRDFFEKMKRKLKRSGYRLHERLVNAVEYGVAQDRDRIILVGFRNGKLSKDFSWLGQIYPDGKAFEYEWPTMDSFQSNGVRTKNETLPHELCVQHWFDKNDVDNHINARHCFKPRNGLKRFKTVPEGDDSKQSFKRLHRWRYSPTAAYGNNEVHLHPYRERRISVAEALAIQSLPKEFELPSSMTLSNMFKTVGNGVPFLVARGLARSVVEHVRKNDAHNSPEHSECHKPTAA